MSNKFRKTAVLKKKKKSFKLKLLSRLSGYTAKDSTGNRWGGTCA